MTDFTDKLINDYIPVVRQNYVEFSPQFTGKFLQWLANKIVYYPSTKPYPGKLSQEEWEKTLNLLKEAGPTVQFEKEADIIYNNPKSYVLWLVFNDINGNKHRIDIQVPKATRNESNGERKIDNRSPFVDELRQDILNGYIEPSKLIIIKDIADAQPNKTGIETVEKKVQYKLNGALVEDALEQAAKEKGVKIDKLDPYGNYYYKGTPGNIADFDIFLNAGKVRIDAKLVKNEITTVTRSESHDASYLVAYSINTKDFIIEKVAECEVDLANDLQFKTILIRAKEILKSAPIIGINNFDYETGKVNFWLFK